MNHAIQRLQRQLASAVKLTLFNKDLKILREDAPLMLSGRLFHKREGFNLCPVAIFHSEVIDKAHSFTNQ